MPLRYRREIAAGRRQRRMAQHLQRLGRADAVPIEKLARQIQPAAPRVLVEVAQDIGQLQGAAERIGDRVRVGARIAEHMHRQMPDRARRRARNTGRASPGPGRGCPRLRPSPCRR